MLDNSRSITVLNGLIANVLDSIDGYQKAAQDADSSRFAEMFNERARDRQSIVGDLQAAVATAGGEPEADGTLLAGAHRAFMGLKEVVTGRDDTAVLEEVERGESYLKARFEEALADTGLTSTARAAVQAAWTSVGGGAAQVAQLKGATNY